MKTATCLILEPSDFTTDGNLRKDAFEALGAHEIILHDARVIKNSITGAVTASNTPARSRTRRPSPTPPEAPTPSNSEHSHTPHTPSVEPEPEQREA